MYGREAAGSKHSRKGREKSKDKGKEDRARCVPNASSFHLKELKSIRVHTGMFSRYCWEEGERGDAFPLNHS